MYKTNLKKLKEYLHINTLEFSEKLGISYSTLGSYERGKRTPSIDFLILLLNKMNVNPYWLLTGNDNMFIENGKNLLMKETKDSIFENILNIGERLNEIQAKNSLKDNDMAKILGIYEYDYIDVKKGDRELSLKIMNKIKQTFNVSIDWLLYGE